MLIVIALRWKAFPTGNFVQCFKEKKNSSCKYSEYGFTNCFHFLQWYTVVHFTSLIQWCMESLNQQRCPWRLLLFKGLSQNRSLPMILTGIRIPPGWRQDRMQHNDGVGTSWWQNWHPWISIHLQETLRPELCACSTRPNVLPECIRTPPTSPPFVLVLLCTLDRKK